MERQTLDTMYELMFLYLKIVGVGISGYFLLSSKNTVDIIFWVMMILWFSFMKFKRSTIDMESDI